MRIFHALSVLLLLISVAPVRAQEPQMVTGVQQTELTGRVFDRNGSVIVGAKVRFSRNKNATVEVYTDSEGIYRAELQPGFYNIEITEPGFHRFEFECYQIPSRGELKLDVTLTVGGEVTCESPGSSKAHKGKIDKKIIIE
jgi:hypothetical protein